MSCSHRHAFRPFLSLLLLAAGCAAPEQETVYPTPAGPGSVTPRPQAAPSGAVPQQPAVAPSGAVLQQPAVAPSSAAPFAGRGPAPQSECVKDADCAQGLVCKSRIWPACELCDGGKSYTTCSPR